MSLEIHCHTRSLFLDAATGSCYTLEVAVRQNASTYIITVHVVMYVYVYVLELFQGVCWGGGGLNNTRAEKGPKAHTTWRGRGIYT